MHSKELPIGKLNAFASLLAERVRAYFQDEQHRREFEVWYRKRYGKDYVWKIERLNQIDSSITTQTGQTIQRPRGLVNK